MKWTAYSEEKPQKVGSYLVTHVTESGHYYVDYDYWTVSDKFKYHPTDVVAWMPFPEPYTADRKDEPQIGEMMTEEEFDSMLARVLTGNDEPQTDWAWK